jgi:hypothetical protein
MTGDPSNLFAKAMPEHLPSLYFEGRVDFFCRDSFLGARRITELQTDLLGPVQAPRLTATRGVSIGETKPRDGLEGDQE